MSAKRDYVMARLAAAESFLRSALDNVRDCVDLFTDPESDADGSERGELMDTADGSAGEAAFLLQMARESMNGLDPAEGEPTPDDEDEEEDTEESEGEPEAA
jgi:hypothetical protein